MCYGGIIIEYHTIITWKNKLEESLHAIIPFILTEYYCNEIISLCVGVSVKGSMT